MEHHACCVHVFPGRYIQPCRTSRTRNSLGAYVLMRCKSIAFAREVFVDNNRSVYLSKATLRACSLFYCFTRTIFAVFGRFSMHRSRTATKMPRGRPKCCTSALAASKPTLCGLWQAMQGANTSAARTNEIVFILGLGVVGA